MPALRIIARDPTRPRARRRARDRPRRGAHAGVRPARDARARSRRSSRREVAALGYELVLGNTFHLLPAPRVGADRRDSAGCTASCAGSGRSSPTRAAFRSSRWGTARVADEIKGRRGRPRGEGAILAIDEEGVRFRSYVDGGERFLGPRARWRCRRRSARTSRSRSTSARRFTSRATTRRARPSAPTAGSSAACAGTPSTAPGRRPPALFYGIVQGGVYEDLRIESAAGGGRERLSTGIAIGGSLGHEKAQMHEVVGWSTRRARAARPRAPAPPARDRRGRRPDPRRRARDRHLRLRDADAARAPRRRRSSPTPQTAGGWRSTGRRSPADPQPLIDGCRCPACAGGLLARLPALPRAHGRADRRAPADAAQPHLRRRG